MTNDIPGTIRAAGTVRAAVAAAMEGDCAQPLLAGADLFAAACIRAAVLYPEWAGAVAGDGSATLDRLAQRLVAASLPLQGATFAEPLGTPQP